MEMRQLKYFIAVAEELHFGRAAERVNISQPPLSMQIKNLEEELGFKLFKRNSRSVELTESGRYFLGKIKSIIDKLDEAKLNASRIARGDSGMLSIGFIGPAMDTCLPEALRDFHSKYPDTTLNLLEMKTDEQLEALASGKIHIGIVRLFEQDLPGFASELIVREPYVLALYDDHHLTRFKKINLKKLNGEPFIFYPRSMHPKLYDAVYICFKNAGFTPDIVQEAKTKKTTLSLVASGIGISIVPESSGKLRLDGVQYRPVKGYLPDVEIYAAWNRKQDNPLITNFLHALKKHRQIIKKTDP